MKEIILKYTFRVKLSFAVWKKRKKNFHSTRVLNGEASLTRATLTAFFSPTSSQCENKEAGEKFMSKYEYPRHETWAHEIRLIVRHEPKFCIKTAFFL